MLNFLDHFGRLHKDIFMKTFHFLTHFSSGEGRESSSPRMTRNTSPLTRDERTVIICDPDPVLIF